MMLATAETRWFFRGGAPEGVWDWFRRGNLWAAQPPRVDEYLVLGSCETAGIKLREGRLEVKVQVESPVAKEYAEGVRGHRDRWIKWSRYAAGAPTGNVFPVEGGETWVRVEKQRTLRRFLLDEVGGEPREIDASSEPSNRTCGVEVTALRVRAPQAASSQSERAADGRKSTSGRGSSAWWTLGFEVDDAGDADTCLGRVARLLFTGPPPIPLDLDASRSYPGWLAGAP